MKTYRIKQVTEILNINAGAVHSYIRKALPEEMKPKKTMQEELGRETYKFTEKNIMKLKKAIKLRETGLTYKEVKEALIEIANVKEANDEVLKETKQIEESEEVVEKEVSSNLINIENSNGKLLASSREIAKNFDKEHKHVMEAARNLMAENSAVKSMVMENEYVNSRGQTFPEYLLTRDGFTLLAMGFTGKKALEWKLKYIKAFNKMEKALQEVYHVSETAIVNSVMENIESKIFTGIDERLAKYEENYRPTHANKIGINSYIKDMLGELQENGEVELVKKRVLLLLGVEAWQDVPYQKLVKSMHLIDDSVRAVKSVRSKSQLSLFEQAN